MGFFSKVFKTIKKNFIALGELPNVKLNMSPAIQIFNILNIDKIIELGEEVSKKQDRVIDVDFLYVIQPTYLDVSNLSDNVKNIAFLKLQRMQANWLYKKSEVTRNSVDSYLNVLENERDKNWKSNMEDFWDMTNLVDDKRKQKFKDYIPDVYGLMNDEGTK